MTLTRVNSICFAIDLGGVLIRLAGQDYFSLWAGEKIPGRRITNLWRDCSELIDQYERGDCETSQFARNLIDQYKLPVSNEEFIATYRDYVIEAMPGARRLLLELRHRGALACLSNTSSVHWRKIEKEMNILDCFDYLMPSHLIKFRKPDQNAYIYMIETLQMNPENIFFFDDSETNVTAARGYGINAFQVKGVRGVRDALSNVLS